MISVPGYVIKERIGAGGMATVYLAVQSSLERLVALKVMAPALAADPAFSKRFLREARTIAGLSNPNIVPIYEVGVTETYLHFFSMQHLPGGDLSNRFRTGLDELELIRVLTLIARALGFAHEHGIVHRDVTPGNILFDKSGNPVLTDFGIARSMADSTRITNTGVSIGTSHYMSPEQARGGNVDARSDLYSLGVVLFEALAGRPPFEGEDGFAIAYAHVFEAPPALPERVAHWQPLVSKALAKDPGERFQNATELIAALTEVAQGQLTDKESVRQFVQNQLHTGSRPAVPRLPVEPGPSQVDTKPAVHTVAETEAVVPSPVERQPLTQTTWFWALVGGIGLVILIVSLAVALRPPPAPDLQQVAAQTPPAQPVSGPPPTPSQAIEQPPPADPTPIDPELALQAQSTSTADGSGEQALPHADIARGNAGIADDAAVVDAPPVNVQPADSDVTDPPATEPWSLPLTPIDDQAMAGPPAPVERTPQQQAQQLLAFADLDLAGNRLLLPQRQNAFERYTAVLRLLPDDERATAGLKAISERYLALAEQVAAAGKADEERLYLDRALQVASSQPRLAETRERIAAIYQARAQVGIDAGQLALRSWDAKAARAGFDAALGWVADHPAALEGLAELERLLKPGYTLSDVLSDGSRGPQLVVVAGGRGPRGEVKGELAVTESEITRALFARYARAVGRVDEKKCRDRESRSIFSRERSATDPGFSQSDDHPQVCINARDADGFAAWLSKATGKRYRLPTEREWALWASRAGKPCDDNVGDRALNNVDRLRRPFDCNDGHAYTAATTQLKPDRDGLRGVIGNVREWLADCALQAPTGCAERAVAGLAWHSETDENYASAGKAPIDESYNGVGFRLIRELADGPPAPSG